MKAFVAVFASVAAASAAPKADPGLLLVDPHASTGETVEHPNGAVVPDDTNSVKLARAHHLTVKAHTFPHVYGYGVPVYGYGKREAEAEPHYGLYGGYGLYGAAVVPKVGHLDTGLIVSPASGAVTPDFTDAQKEGGLGEGTHAIKVPVVTGHTVLVGKRSADAYYGLGYGYGGYGLGYGHYYGKRSADSDAYYGYGVGLGYGYGLGYGGYYGKRSADAEPHYGLYGGYGYGLVHPAVGVADTGLILSLPSGAVTPDYTAAQKEAGLGEGTHPIKVPVVVGKREAEADPSLVAHPNGAVTPDYTPAQKLAAAHHFALKGYGYGYGLGYGYHYGKRSADAYYGLGYGYGGYGLGYGGYYGKRSADSEADAYYAAYHYPAYTAGYAYYG